MGIEEKMLAAAEAPRVAVKEPPKPQVFPVGKDNLPVLVLPEGFTSQSMQHAIAEFERMQPSPKRRHGTYIASDIESLLKWMRENTADDAPVFACGLEKLNGEWRNPRLALIGIGNYSVPSDGPMWHDFQCRYDFPVSPEWKAWAEMHEQPFAQADFAEFIENRIYDVSTQEDGEDLPEAVDRFLDASGKKNYATISELYRVSREFRVRVEAETEVVLNPDTGEQTLRYNENHIGKGGRDVNIPNLFFIRIPVFFGMKPVLIGVKLRYRQAGGKVCWLYSLFAPEMVVANEFKAACDLVRKDNRTVYLGVPDMP